jgi:hypothetical protein
VNSSFPLQARVFPKLLQLISVSPTQPAFSGLLENNQHSAQQATDLARQKKSNQTKKKKGQLRPCGTK